MPDALPHPAAPPPGALLPRPEGLEAYAALRGDPAVWLPAMRAICARHGLPDEQLYLEPSALHVVFAVGREAWIKLVWPAWRAEYERERTALEALAGCADVPAPALRAAGQIEDWWYLVLGVVPGERLGDVWEDLAPGAQAHVAGALGSAVAHLHATPTAALRALRHDWRRFVERQQAGCVARHAARGADVRWQREIATFLHEIEPLVDPGLVPVLLHGDLTDDQVLVRRAGEALVVTGLIDFSDAMLGDPLYDLAGPAAFLTQGRPWALRALLRGYGIPESGWRASLGDRLLAHALLNRFASLDLLLAMGPHPRPDSLAGLRRSFFDPA